MNSAPHTNGTLDHAAARRASAKPGRTIILRIQRCEGPGKPSRFEDFRVPVPPGANVISALQHVAANPVTADGRATTPVVWDSGCLEEVCGACTMVINGKVRQSCSCLLDEYAPGEGDVITLQPMSKFPVVRDLWVDRSRVFRALTRLKAWVPIDGTHNLGAGPRELPEPQETRYTLSTCMTCGCCLEACPQYEKIEDQGTPEANRAAWDSAFVGAHAVSQARLFNMHPTGAALKGDRLEELAGPGGINHCGNAQNCVKVCPKKIPLTESIGAIGRAVTLHKIKSFFVR